MRSKEKKVATSPTREKKRKEPSSIFFLKLSIDNVQWKHLDKRLVFIYNHSSVHKKRGDDALDAKKLNLNPGGKQPQMHNTGL